MKNLGQLSGHSPKAKHVNNSGSSAKWLGATKNVAGKAKSVKTEIGKPMKPGKFGC